VLEQLRLIARGQLAVRVDGHRRIPDLRLRVGDAQLAGQHDRPVERHEGQPMAADHPDPDRAEGRLVRARVHVHCFELSDLLPIGVDHIVFSPVTDVLSFEHAVDLPFLAQSKRHVNVTKQTVPGCANSRSWGR
jgi:hypothetical protein